MAEFQEVMRQAARMCASHGNDCTDCVLHKEDYVCPFDNLPEGMNLKGLPDVESMIMHWAANNPEPRYPSWVEWQKANFPASGNLICPAVYMPKSYCEGNCTACRKKPIPADIAEKLGIKPMGGDADA